MRFLSLSAITLSTLLLTACGGSLEGETTESTEDTVVATGDQTPVTDITDNDTATVEEEIIVENAAPSEPGIPASIAYIGASQSWVAIQGTGGADRRESSAITFQLLDRNGDPIIEGKTVTFSVNAPSGTFLDPIKGTTDDKGYVSTTVSSGKVPGPVTVHVELDEKSTIKALSGVLAVTTGLPAQKRMSLSVSERAPEAWETDGVLVEVTARLADRWNNTVPDGTVVFFHTEDGGHIQGKEEPIGFCLTKLGACSVNWTSAGTRPSDGRVTITAYADGEESFTDKNGDGWFTEGDVFTIVTDKGFNGRTDLGEVFYDYNRNGVYDELSEEEFKDQDTAANPLDGAYNQADGMFTGVLCSDVQESLGGCIKSLVQVRRNTEIVMSSKKLKCEIYNGADIVTNTTLDLTSTGKASYTLQLAMTDINGNTPPEGTSATLTTENGSLSGETSWSVLPPDDLAAYVQTVTLMREATPNLQASGEMELSLTTPAGITSKCTLRVKDDG